jgi:phage recombination protein Bet
MTEARALAIVQDGGLSTAQILSGLNAVREVLAPELTNEELKLFAMVANRSGLDPFAKQIYAVKRKNRVTFQTSIDGYRSIAERTGEYDQSDEPEYGPMVEGSPRHPEWARVTVYRFRGGRRVGQSATAYWDEFHPGGDAPMWSKMPRNQLAKCAEALALRKAFPYVLADIYTTEEMAQADARDAAEARAERVSALPIRERVAARRAQYEAPANANPEETAQALESVEAPAEFAELEF